MTLDQGVIRLISAPCFLATKLEAFHNRGRKDFVGSGDIEDVITVVDGRPEIVAEVSQADTLVREFVARTFRVWLQDPQFNAAIAACLLPSAASQARAKAIVERLQNMAP